MRKGFLSRTNRSSKELQPAAQAKSQVAEHDEVLRKVAENQSLLDQQKAQEEELQRRLEGLQRQAEQLKESKRREVAWQQQVVSKVVEVESEFEGLCASLLNDRKKSSQECLAGVHRSVSETKKRFQSIQTWGDAGHKVLQELSSDVQAVRELYEVEAKGREETSTEQVRQVSDVTEKLGDVKGFAQLLRARVRLIKGADSFYKGSGFDGQHFADISSDFSALPTATKFWALIDDAFVLRLAAFGLTAGMMLGLGVCVEFGPSFV
jgi:chromosome segregation ATPase